MTASVEIGLQHWTADEFLRLVLDNGSFDSWDTPVVDPDGISTEYSEELRLAREKTGLDESVVTGEGVLHGHRVAVMVSEFGFLAGSIGIAAADRLVRAIEKATTQELPLLAAPVSGGTRMQEGTVAFVQMIRISAAIARHKEQALPYLVYLRSPTTGGVFASWGSVGQVTVAQPGALIGLLGPRVYEALYGKPFPDNVQLAENLYKHGIIDAVLEPAEWSLLVNRTLTVMRGKSMVPTRTAIPASEVIDPRPTWESVTRSRRSGRPGVRDLLRHAATDVVLLNGTGEGEQDPALIVALARFGGVSCICLGQDRDGQTATHAMGPGALREARRGMRLAAEMRLPLLSVIDTPGAALSVEAEESGLAGEIARCMSHLVTLDVPVVALILGQGSGGGALALLPADRVLAAQHAWLSPLLPEGASAIVHRTAELASVMAEEQRISSTDLLRNRIVDRIIPEQIDAAEAAESFCRRVGKAISEEFAIAMDQDGTHRITSRLGRYQARR